MDEEVQFIKCDIFNDQWIVDYYKNHLNLKTHFDNLNKPDIIRKYGDVCKDNFNNSSLNKHTKKNAGFANI